MSRPSSVYRTSTAPSSVRSRAHQPEFSFPFLDFHEIALCLRGCGFVASEEAFLKPTPQYIQTLCEQIAEEFLGTSQKDLRSALAVSSAEYDIDDSQFEARNLMALRRVLHGFLVDCGIDDFTIMDMIRPEPQRIRKIMSAVVNFARFRDDHIADCEKIMQKSEEIDYKDGVLADENEKLHENITELESRVEIDLQRRNQLDQHNSEVETELRKCKRIQESLVTERENYKQEKARLCANLEDRNFMVLETKKEIDRVKPYIVDSPDLLHKINSDMTESLESAKQELENLEKRARKLQTSNDSFAIIESDLRSCLKLVEEIETELQKEEEASKKLNRFQELHDGNTITLHQLVRKIQQLQRQIVNSDERIDRLKQQSETKSKKTKDSMAALKDRYSTLVAERTVTQQDIDQKKAFIESTEKQMTELKSACDNEIRETEIEAQRLKAHISMYLNEMEQRIALTSR